MNAPNVIRDRAHGAARYPRFLRIPPFPGRIKEAFLELPEASSAVTGQAIGDRLQLVRKLRVGGQFWGAQPSLPEEYIIVTSAALLPFAADLCLGAAVVGPGMGVFPPGKKVVSVGDCDPWYLLSRARGLLCESDDELRLVAAILGVPIYARIASHGPPLHEVADPAVMLDAALNWTAVVNPFTGKAMDFAETAALCGFWRALIDSNRVIGAAVGFAFWKRPSVEPLLWNGSTRTNFFRTPDSGAANGSVAIWRSKTPVGILERFERDGTPLVEVEDGFLRSNGLGADCVPPLSITVDRLGPYFDPGQPSELEQLLQEGPFKPSLLERARLLRETVVAAGLGKYGQGEVALERFHPAKRHLLVIGQVEDDQSLLTGGSGLTSNLDLLMRVRAREPDSYVIYKPHPDVAAGHRRGYVSEYDWQRFADKIVADVPISSLIALVDEVHVNTSLAGFEALMRGKKVTTYGVPFFAGWGLTCDLGPVPPRRTARRNLDELVAATLLLYPRYLDPITGLPCPAEVVVDRLRNVPASRVGALVAIRRLQGKIRRGLRNLMR